MDRNYLPKNRRPARNRKKEADAKIWRDVFILILSLLVILLLFGRL